MEVTAELVSPTNPNGTITNSDLELTNLVLQETTLLEAAPKACMAAPHSGSDNTPTISWSMQEASMINPVVADLLHIRVLHGRFVFLNPSVYYHTGQESCMEDDAPSLLYLSDNKFYTHMYVVHPQLRGLWQISLPSQELLSCMISTMRRNL